MSENRNDQLVQARERKLRAANFIIHGVAEAEADTDEDSNNQEYVISMLRSIGVNSDPQSTLRLGIKSPEKVRPIKVKMKTEEEKALVMSRLTNLKKC